VIDAGCPPSVILVDEVSWLREAKGEKGLVRQWFESRWRRLVVPAAVVGLG
jgi:hypothetical protein